MSTTGAFCSCKFLAQLMDMTLQISIWIWIPSS